MVQVGHHARGRSRQARERVKRALALAADANRVCEHPDRAHSHPRAERRRINRVRGCVRTALRKFLYVMMTCDWGESTAARGEFPDNMLFLH